MAFWGALLWSVHPVNVEAVASIGYRADLLAGLFVLSGTAFWILFRRYGGWPFWGAWLAYFLGLFSKEVVILLPLFFWLIDRHSRIELKGKKLWPYAALLFLAAFFCYIYFFVFPNPVLIRGYAWQGESPWHVFLINGEILRQYIAGVLWPGGVRILPGLFYPLPDRFSWWWAASSWVIVSFLVVWLAWAQRSMKVHVLLLFWSLLFWLPVANILPNPNPVAYRYLYVPLMGACGLMAMVCLKAGHMSGLKTYAPDVARIVLTGLVAVSAMTTIFNIKLWRDNASISSALVMLYPDHYKGHSALAYEYIQRGELRRAAHHLEVAMTDPRMHDPAVLCLLADVYMQMDRTADAYFYLRQVIALRPDYPQGYAGMADYFAKKGQPRMERMFRAKASDLRR